MKRYSDLTAQGPPTPKRRRAKKVLWAAGALAFLGLAGGGIASSHLTSSLSDYDAPGSAVVLAQHQIQLATGANPEEGYEVVVRTPAPIDGTSAVPTRGPPVTLTLMTLPDGANVTLTGTAVEPAPAWRHDAARRPPLAMATAAAARAKAT